MEMRSINSLKSFEKPAFSAAFTCNYYVVSVKSGFCLTLGALDRLFYFCKSPRALHIIIFSDLYKQFVKIIRSNLALCGRLHD